MPVHARYHGLESRATKELQMRGRSAMSIILLALSAAIVLGQPATPPSTRPAGQARVYTTTRPSSDGIGKVYMGREIAQVMGHLGADWLERPDREQEEQPTKAIALMELKPTAIVADIGAGPGYFSFRMAKKVP